MEAFQQIQELNHETETASSVNDSETTSSQSTNIENNITEPDEPTPDENNEIAINKEAEVAIEAELDPADEGRRRRRRSSAS